jgi:hypothetical protein
VQHISESLAAAGEPDEPVVLDRRGPHRSIQALDRLLGDAIDAEESARRDDPPDDREADPGER